MDDRHDLSALHRGDGTYFADLVRRFSPRLLFVAKSFTKDPDHAHDLVQATWMRVYQKRRDYSGVGSLAGWIGGVCRHVCLNDRRARDSQERLLRAFGRQAAADGARQVGEEAARASRLQQIHRALAALTPKEREAFVLTYQEGLTSMEVGARLRMNQSTVRVHLANARQKIRSHLGVP